MLLGYARVSKADGSQVLDLGYPRKAGHLMTSTT